MKSKFFLLLLLSFVFIASNAIAQRTLTIEKGFASLSTPTDTLWKQHIGNIKKDTANTLGNHLFTIGGNHQVSTFYISNINVLKVNGAVQAVSSANIFNGLSANIQTFGGGGSSGGGGGTLAPNAATESNQQKQIDSSLIAINLQRADKAVQDTIAARLLRIENKQQGFDPNLPFIRNFDSTTSKTIKDSATYTLLKNLTAIIKDSSSKFLVAKIIDTLHNSNVLLNQIKSQDSTLLSRKLVTVANPYTVNALDSSKYRKFVSIDNFPTQQDSTSLSRKLVTVSNPYVVNALDSTKYRKILSVDNFPLDSLSKIISHLKQLRYFDSLTLVKAQETLDTLIIGNANRRLLATEASLHDAFLELQSLNTKDFATETTLKNVLANQTNGNQTTKISDANGIGFELTTLANSKPLPTMIVDANGDQITNFGSSSWGGGDQLQASTAPIATNKAQVVSISPNGSNVTANQTLATAAFSKITDGTNTATVKAGSTSPALADPALVVSISGNTPNMGSLAPSSVPTRMAVSGGTFNTTLPTLTNGQSAALQMDAAGRTLVQQRVRSLLSYANPTTSATANTSTNLLAANANRERIIITNNGTTDVWINVNGTAAVVGQGDRIAANGGYYITPYGLADVAAINVISTAVSVQLNVKEY